MPVSAAFAIANHLVGQAICDNIDERHKQFSHRKCGETATRKVFASALRKT